MKYDVALSAGVRGSLVGGCNYSLGRLLSPIVRSPSVFAVFVRRSLANKREASVVMQRLSYSTETVLSNKITRNTGRMGWMAHRKWKKIKQQPSMLPGPTVPGSCLAFFHFLWAIHPIRPVYQTRTITGCFISIFH